MYTYDFDIKSAFNYIACGKFQAPHPDWIHYHRKLYEFEFILVTEGILYISDGSYNYRISPGEYLLMAPTENQYGYKPSNCAFYWMHFSYHQGLNNPTRHYSIESISYSPNHLFLSQHDVLPAPERIIILMKQLQDSEKRYHESILNNALVTSILAETANQSSIFHHFINTYSGDQLYNDISNFIQMHASENFRVSDLASYFGYNQKYLTSFFHKHAGCSIKQFILQTKMEIAKAELTDSNHSISQVAYNIGFDDVHNFSNAFKKIVGLSPSAYRNSFTKGSMNNK